MYLPLVDDPIFFPGLGRQGYGTYRTVTRLYRAVLLSSVGASPTSSQKERPESPRASLIDVRELCRFCQTSIHESLTRISVWIFRGKDEMMMIDPIQKIRRKVEDHLTRVE